MSENRTLTGKQHKAIEALMQAGDVTHAAAEAGIARDTLYRWMKQPAFQQAMRDAEARSLDEVSRVLIRLSRSAVGTLAQAMSDKEGPLGTRVRAADIALSRLLQVRELAVLEQRLSALEQQAGIAESKR